MKSLNLRFEKKFGSIEDILMGYGETISSGTNIPYFFKKEKIISPKVIGVFQEPSENNDRQAIQEYYNPMIRISPEIDISDRVYPELIAIIYDNQVMNDWVLRLNMGDADFYNRLAFFNQDEIPNFEEKAVYPEKNYLYPPIEKTSTEILLQTYDRMKKDVEEFESNLKNYGLAKSEFFKLRFFSQLSKKYEIELAKLNAI